MRKSAVRRPKHDAFGARGALEEGVGALFRRQMGWSLIAVLLRASSSGVRVPGGGIGSSTVYDTTEPVGIKRSRSIRNRAIAPLEVFLWVLFQAFLL